MKNNISSKMSIVNLLVLLIVSSILMFTKNLSNELMLRSFFQTLKRATGLVEISLTIFSWPHLFILILTIVTLVSSYQGENKILIITNQLVIGLLSFFSSVIHFILFYHDVMFTKGMVDSILYPIIFLVGLLLIINAVIYTEEKRSKGEKIQIFKNLSISIFVLYLNLYLYLNGFWGGILSFAVIFAIFIFFQARKKVSLLVCIKIFIFFLFINSFIIVFYETILPIFLI